MIILYTPYISRTDIFCNFGLAGEIHDGLLKWKFLRGLTREIHENKPTVKITTYTVISSRVVYSNVTVYKKKNTVKLVTLKFFLFFKPLTILLMCKYFRVSFLFHIRDSYVVHTSHIFKTGNMLLQSHSNVCLFLDTKVNPVMLFPGRLTFHSVVTIS